MINLTMATHRTCLVQAPDLQDVLSRARDDLPLRFFFGICTDAKQLLQSILCLDSCPLDACNIETPILLLLKWWRNDRVCIGLRAAPE